MTPRTFWDANGWLWAETESERGPDMLTPLWSPAHGSPDWFAEGEAYRVSIEQVAGPLIGAS